MAFVSGTLLTATAGAEASSTDAGTPAELGANVNDYDAGTHFMQRWSSDASRNVTGMVAGADSEARLVWNVGAQNIVLKHEDVASAAANRWKSATGADLTLAANKCALAQYDATTARWRVTLLP